MSALAHMVCVAAWVWLATGLGAPLAAQMRAASMEDPLQAVAPPALGGTTTSILDLQTFREDQTATAADGTRIRLVSLNPRVNAWFLLQISRKGGEPKTYHIENPAPRDRTLRLADGEAALEIDDRAGRTSCQPWLGDMIAHVQRAGDPFAWLCDGTLLLRSPADGATTAMERTAQILRDNLVQGETMVNAVKAVLNEDRFRISSHLSAAAQGRLPDAGPGHAVLRDYPTMSTEIDLPLRDAPANGVVMGHWYAIAHVPGVYASSIQPRMIHPDILNRAGETHPLDRVERAADVYLIAFDLRQFDIGYETGTEHPRLGWSPRPSGAGVDPSLPGPDGFDSAAPLVPAGMVSPAHAHRVVATFTGGFKRSHGAFRTGLKSQSNHGHHYGIVVHGTVMSRLQPGLSTLYVQTDGTVGMKTWTASDDKQLLPRLRFARQNGVPLIEWDAARGESVPGALVMNWLEGNWSGSKDAELRTLRAGGCLKTTAKASYLIYGWFSTATPSAMARTFQAYGCDHAMLLDMNAIEHTYLALYQSCGTQCREIHHLVPAMDKLDRRGPDGRRVPRFVGIPDNRDLFYVLRRGAGE